jgi:hypothetical protein
MPSGISKNEQNLKPKTQRERKHYKNVIKGNEALVYHCGGSSSF